MKGSIGDKHIENSLKNISWRIVGISWNFCQGGWESEEEELQELGDWEWQSTGLLEMEASILGW